MSSVFVECTASLESPGELTYRVADYAFDFQPAGIVDPTILLFGSVQVEADSTGRCRYAWGYSPFQGWRKARLPELPTPSSSVCVLLGEVEPGDVLVVTEPANTVATVDPDTGSVWMRAGSVSSETYDWAASIAPGVEILGWEDGSVGGLLLTPTNSFEVLDVVKAT